MKRGLVTLTQSEFMLFKDIEFESSLLATKLSSINSTSQSIDLELSAEEAETILDALPAPDPSQPVTISTRQKLNSIIS